MTVRGTLIAVGDNCLDVYLSKNRMAVGGNALNVAAQWRAQGLDARYFGIVGRDAEGDQILAASSAAGLAAEDIERGEGNTAVTLLLEQQGDRRFLLEDLGIGLGYRPDPTRHALLRQATWVHLGTNTPEALVRQLVADGVPFSVDVSTNHEDLALEGVPLVFASGPEAAEEPVEPVLSRLRSRGAGCIVMTCGRRGAFLMEGNELVHVAARPIEVVDTCGAGDSFIAAFIVATISGRSGKEGLEIATQSAARTCGHEGGFPQELAPIPQWLLDKYTEVIGTAEL